MTKWEYRMALVHTNHDRGEPDPVEVLNELGDEGWEAVALVPTTASRHGLGVESSNFLVLLKRPRSTK